MKKNYLLIAMVLISGLFAPKAKAQITLMAPYIGHTCDSEIFNIYTTGYTSGLTVTTYFGDGSSASHAIVTGGYAYSFFHNYASPGYYSIKNVLYSSGVAIDSTMTTDTVNRCTYIPVGVYTDKNSNCVADIGESIVSPFTVEIDSAGIPIDTLTLTSIFYATRGIPPGGTIYSFKVLTPPVNHTPSCPSTGIVTYTIGSTTTAPQIGFSCSGSGFDLSIYQWFAAIPTGGHAMFNVVNYGCTPQAATVTLTYSPKYLYSSTSPSTISATTGTNTVTYNLGTIPAESNVYFWSDFTAVGTLTLGDTVNTSSVVSPVTGDLNPANNSSSNLSVIKSSYDPNGKSVSPEGMIAAGTLLTYNITFENTGNAPAANIHVQDTLSNNLDLNTFKLITSSAPVTSTISQDASGHAVVKFDFHGINLLDSSHHGQCDGNVIFSIKTKSGLSGGTKIDNRAGIYFDYNSVVMTNNVENIIFLPTATAMISNTGFELYPNPANDVLTIKADNGAYSSLTITNTIGQTVASQAISTPVTKVSVKNLPAGMYYITVRGESGIKVQPFEKL